MGRGRAPSFRHLRYPCLVSQAGRDGRRGEGVLKGLRGDRAMQKATREEEGQWWLRVIMPSPHQASVWWMYGYRVPRAKAEWPFAWHVSAVHLPPSPLKLLPSKPLSPINLPLPAHTCARLWNTPGVRGSTPPTPPPPLFFSPWVSSARAPTPASSRPPSRCASIKETLGKEPLAAPPRICTAKRRGQA